VEAAPVNLAAGRQDGYTIARGAIEIRRKMIPLIQFLAMVIDLYIWVIIASAVLSWLIAFGVVNTSNRFVYLLADGLYRMTEPALRPLRRFIPDLGGIDITPVVLILILLFIKNVVLFGWLAPAAI
jgi:YggT family protein